MKKTIRPLWITKNAKTGKIVSTKTETPKDQAKEATADKKKP